LPLILAFVEAAVLFFAAGAEGLVAGRDLLATLAQALIFTIGGLCAFHFSDLYDLRRVRRFGQFAARLPQALLFMAVLVGLVHAFVPDLRIGWQSGVILAFVLAMLLPLRAAVHHLVGTHPFSRRVLVLGTTALAGKIVREMLDEPDLRDVVVGVVDDGSAAFKPVLPCLRLGSMEKLGTIIEGFEPDLIVYALPESQDPAVVRELAVSRARRVPVEDGLAVYERLTGKIAIEYAAPRAVLFSNDQASWITLAFARALSVVAAVGGIVLLSPLVIPIALLIKLDSGGPVFFLHERVGLGGRPFNLIKFRTMHLGGALSEWAADNVHRTTRVGRWLRRFRIDELPQFWNILQGDMNLVGPRPHPVSNFALFNSSIPYYGRRCSVRPGVTGWAQIRYGYANDLEEETEKMRYDLHYIKHMSVSLDAQILFETVKVVLTGSRSSALDEPGAQVSPIYFGIEQRRSARRTARPLGPHEAPAPAPTDGVVSFEEHRTKSPRAPSSGVA
jgi:exopolysaccharide biosynthesis polyprenyl glycosylphosphotransferase